MEKGKREVKDKNGKHSFNPPFVLFVVGFLVSPVCHIFRMLSVYFFKLRFGLFQRKESKFLKRIAVTNSKNNLEFLILWLLRKEECKMIRGITPIKRKRTFVINLINVV